MRKLIESFNRYLFYLAAVPLSLMMVMTVIDVSGRYFRYPLPGTMEVSNLLLTATATLTWAHIQARKGHISIDVLFNRISARARAITTLFTSFAALVIVSLIAWQTIPAIELARRHQEWTDVLQVPIWPFKAILFFGVFCLGLQLVMDIIHYARGSGR